MQLCRFELRDEPGIARSGIFFENRLYETDGQKAIGVHDLSKIALLPPVLPPPSIRMFDADGQYTYLNPEGLLGPLSEVDIPSASLSAYGHLAALVQTQGEQFEGEEASQAILGYTLCFSFARNDSSLSEVERRDLPIAIGPFLSTPEVLTGTASTWSLEWTLKINGLEIAQWAAEEPKAERWLERASRLRAMLPGDLLVGPALPFPDLTQSALGRNLQPGDSLQLAEKSLGVLTVKLT